MYLLFIPLILKPQPVAKLRRDFALINEAVALWWQIKLSTYAPIKIIDFSTIYVLFLLVQNEMKCSYQ